MKLDPNTFSTSLPHGWRPADRFTVHRQLIFHKMSLSRAGAQWKQSSRFQANLLLSVRVIQHFLFSLSFFFFVDENYFSFIILSREEWRKRICVKVTSSENSTLKNPFREKFIIAKLSIMSSLDYLPSWLRDCCCLKLTVPPNFPCKYERRKLHDVFN